MRYGVTMFATDRRSTSSSWRGRPRRGASSRSGCPSTPTSRSAAARRRRPATPSWPRSTGGASTRSWRSPRRPRPPDACGSAPASCSPPSGSRSSPPRRVATLDLLAAAGSTLGVGFGWNEDELEHHGVDYGRPARRRARARCSRCRRCGRTTRRRSTGEHVPFAPSWSWPKPVQRPTVARVPSSRRRRRARSCSPTSPSTATAGSRSAGAGLTDAIPRLREAVAAAGRDPTRSDRARSGRSPTPASSTTSSGSASPSACSACPARPPTSSSRSSTTRPPSSPAERERRPARRARWPATASVPPTSSGHGGEAVVYALDAERVLRAHRHEAADHARRIGELYGRRRALGGALRPARGPGGPRRR